MEILLMCMLFLVIAAALFWVVFVCYQCVNVLWWMPKHHAFVAQKQDIKGPPPSLLWGNSMDIKRLRESVPDCLPSFRHDCTVQQLLPEHVLWSKRYGKRYLIWLGPEAHIVTTDMEILKEILCSKQALSFGKPLLLQQFLEPVTGIGLILANGDTWAHERRIIGPAFHFEKLKGFAQVMVKIAEEMVGTWNQKIMDGNGEAEIDMEKSMATLTADIIAHTQFGSSYQRGRKVFQYLEDLKEFVFKYGHLLIIPGMSYLPIPIFMKLRRLKRVVKISIREIIKDRKAAVQAGGNVSYGADLLGLMLSESEKVCENKSLPQLSMQQLIDECKTFFFAGHETTALLLTWALLLLAHDTRWQEKARSEVLNLCNGKLLDFDVATKMKIVEMILYETLRLFAPANSIVRVALCDVKVGGVFIPKGMSFWIPITAIHMDPELWGDGVYEFDPERFADGISKAAKHPMAFLPFAHGPRNCIGQAFALMEAKLVLATLLMNFSFHPSPAYKHAPQLMVTTRPKYGAPVIVKRLPVKHQ